jgi:hypothetical protein
MAAAKKPTVRKTVKAAEAAARPSKPATDVFATAANDHFQSVFSAFSENAETLRGQAEEILAAVKGNVETSQSRLQSMAADIAAAAREEAADAVTFVNELARARTVADALEIQRSYWTNLFEARVERAHEMTRNSVEAARESFEPFSKTLAAMPAMSAFDRFFPFPTK